MIINVRLREFLHELGYLDRFIKNTEAATYAPKVVTSIIEAFVWMSTPEGHEFWKFLALAFDKGRARYTIIEPKKYQGDDDSRAE